MADRVLRVSILGDDRSFQQALGRSEKRTRGFQSQVTGVAPLITRAFAAAGVSIGAAVAVDKIGEAVSAASDLNEQISKSRQIFGDSSGAIEDWSRTTARSFGIAQAEALTATGTFGNLFRVVGIAPQVAGDMSQALVKLAADLASFNNASPEDVLQAIRSGLIGEAEPLRRYGVLLSEARVQQEALASTGKTNVKALTDQEKALARYQIILRDTAPAQGDFARTSDGLANQSRILRAQLNDLSANIGGVLIPVLTDAAEVANLLFLALDKFRGIDFSPGFEFPDPPDWLKAFAFAPISPAGAVALAIKRALEDSAKEIEAATRPDDLAGPRGPGAVAAENTRIAIKEREQEMQKIASDLQRSRRRFAAFTKGLGLKLDRAGLTQALDDDVAVLRELERAIVRQIEREGRTFKLVEQLTQVRQALADTIADRAEEQARRSRDAFENMLGTLDLQLDRATDTARLDDDLRALRLIEAALRRRIESEGSTLELEQRLLDIRRQQAEIRKRLVEQQERARESRQFRALGLTAEGEERIPSAGALRKRLGSLEEQIQGTPLDTRKTAQQLDRIARVLSGKFGKVGKDVRAAIKRMLDEIRAGLKGESVDVEGPLTETTSLNSRRIIRGLGLTPDQTRELRARLSDFNSAGIALGQPRTSTSAEGFGGIQGSIFVESHITVELDGQKVGAAVTRQQQKARRRNPRQKRGPNRPRNI